MHTEALTSVMSGTRKMLTESLSSCFIFLVLGSPGFWNPPVTHTHAIPFAILGLVLVLLEWPRNFVLHTISDQLAVTSQSVALRQRRERVGSRGRKTRMDQRCVPRACEGAFAVPGHALVLVGAPSQTAWR